MNKEKLNELKQRMVHHEVENDIAIIKLTVKELFELIELAEKQLTNSK